MSVRKYYIRFLIWLGADPSLDDQSCQEQSEIDTSSNLSSWPSIRKAKQYNLLKIAIVIPFFLFLIIIFMLAGDWKTAVLISGILAGVVLFAISYLFQAGVVLVGALFLFSQGHWLIGLGLIVLSMYLMFAATLTDADFARTMKQVRTISPAAYQRLSKYVAQRDNLSAMFEKYLKILLVVFGIVVVIYGCQVVITMDW
jgi:hypothetical protein